LSKAIKLGFSNGQVNEEIRIELDKALDSMEAPADHATKQLSKFLNQTGGHIVNVDMANIKTVVDRYFRREAPFSSQGKKDEFPDAIALLSLEKWASDNKKRILAVSKDNDWKVFAAKSDHIDVVEDLGRALSLLNDQAGGTVPKAIEVLNLIESGDTDLGQKFKLLLEQALESKNPVIRFDSIASGVDDGAVLSLKEFQIGDLEEQSGVIDIVRTGTRDFSFRVPVYIEADLRVKISLFDNDIDDNPIPIGSTAIAQGTEFDAFLLLDISLSSNDNEGNSSVIYEINNVELLAMPDIHVGYIDYDIRELEDEFEMDYFLD